MSEPLLIGWNEIAEVLHWHPKYACSLKQKLIEDGIVFYRWFGRPPRRRPCSYESLIKAHERRKGTL